MNATGEKLAYVSEAHQPPEPSVVTHKKTSSLRRGFNMLMAGLLASVGSWTEENASAQEPIKLQNNGALVIAGGGDMPAEVHEKFIALAGGEKAKIVVIPTASIDADDPTKTVSDFWTANYRMELVKVLHTRDRAIADTDEFAAPLKDATGVWISGGKQTRLTEVYLGTKVEQELHNVRGRGGVLGGTSAGAAVMSSVMIEGGNPVPKLGKGFGFFRGKNVVDQHFLRREREPRMLNALSAYPDHSGFGVDESTALVIEKHGMCVVGKGMVSCYTPNKKDRSVQQFSHGQQILLPEADMLVASPMAER